MGMTASTASGHAAVFGAAADGATGTNSHGIADVDKQVRRSLLTTSGDPERRRPKLSEIPPRGRLVISLVCTASLRTTIRKLCAYGPPAPRRHPEDPAMERRGRDGHGWGRCIRRYRRSSG